MPLYEYQCQQCGHRFEKIQSFSAPDEKACPNCGGPVERLISAPAIQFKGAGWYVNDYAGRNKAPSSGSSDSGSKESGGGKDASGGGSEISAKTDGGSKSDSGGSKSDSGASPNSSDSAAKPSAPSSNTKSSD